MVSEPTPRADLEELAEYHSPQLDVAVRLNTNESPYRPPDEFVEEWLAACRDLDLNRYPDRGAVELRAAIGAFLGQPTERVFVGNGSNEILQTLLLTYGGAGRRAAIFEPTYALHGHIARITGTEVVVGTRRADFTIDPDAAAALVAETQPALVFACSPNNPSGTLESATTLNALLDVATGLVVVDEAYGEFTTDSALSHVADDGGLVVVRTYSKVWSMAALRLGFCIASTSVIAELEKVVLPYSLAAPTQLAGTIALRYVDAMRGRVQALVDERERVAAALEGRLGLTVFPSGANFVLLRFERDAGDVWQQLLDRGVLVRDFSRRPGLEECLRVTIGTPEENDAFLMALEASMEEVAA
jgi:histidinol-phosphate aminotransferase